MEAEAEAIVLTAQEVKNRRFPKRCTKCGVVYSEEEWKILPLVGIQHDEIADFEMRNCKYCNTTLAVVHKIHDPTRLNEL
jgi:hypothetical protein